MDAAFYSTINLLIGAAITPVVNYFTDRRKEKLVDKERDRQEERDKIQAEAKAQTEWNECLNLLRVLKAKVAQADSALSLSQAISSIGSFLERNPRMLRHDGNLEFFVRFCGSMRLNKLSALDRSPTATATNSELVDFKDAVLTSLQNVALVPQSVLNAYEHAETEKLLELFSNGDRTRFTS